MNICQCPTPPSGSITCETDQLAVCVVKNGEPFTRCYDVPKQRTAELLVLWTYEVITGSDTQSQNAPIYNVIDTLLSGSYSRWDNAFESTFKLPRSIKSAIDDLRDGLVQQY